MLRINGLVVISGRSYVGDLKKRRLDLGLRQKDAALRIGVNQRSYENWETEKHEPEFRTGPG